MDDMIGKFYSVSHGSFGNFYMYVVNKFNSNKLLVFEFNSELIDISVTDLYKNPSFKVKEIQPTPEIYRLFFTGLFEDIWYNQLAKDI